MMGVYVFSVAPSARRSFFRILYLRLFSGLQSSRSPAETNAFLKSSDSPLFIKSNEENLACEMTLSINGKLKQVKLKGIADRIDQFEGGYRIIDYKTGKVESREVNLKDVSQISDKPKALQLILYAYMFFQIKPEINEVSSHIFALRNIKDTNFPLAINKDSVLSSNEMSEVESIISEIIEDMYSDLPLEHNEKAVYCGYC